MIIGLIIVVFILLIAVVWVRGIDHMHENYPEYKGEDWLNWDENKNHTEGDF